MVHPADGEAWKDFDLKHPDFAAEARNVRLGLCADGFTAFKMGGRPYTLWPVFIVCYNLPPGMAMRDQFVFMSLLIPGPDSPGKSIDIYLQPLIDELKSLWTDGVEVYDSFRKQNFKLRAALMWTINDYPAYGMLSGWSTHGKLGCPVCMEDTKAFTLGKGGKPCWFDCHRRFLPEDHMFRFQSDSFKKDTIEVDPPPRRLTGEEIHARVQLLENVTFGKDANDERLPGFGVRHNWLKKSIFWELPYWPDLLVRHFIDVMHLEMNFFKNIFFTLLDIKDKTKDNEKAREDMAELCARALLEMFRNEAGKLMRPHASYCLKKPQKRQLCEWIKDLKFPDGYASNLSNIVNVQDCSFVGLKSHDCHVFMERLLPAAFRDFIPEDIWEVIVEVSNYFRDLCARELNLEHVKKLESNIPVTLCKLEKIFPPGFFDSMEHLAIHVAYEARVGGPLQFHWMYPFERAIKRLKRKITNKARVEGSIVEAYVLEEISNFCCFYFSEEIATHLKRTERYNDGGYVDGDPRLSIVSYPGRAITQVNIRNLSEKELKAAHNYVLQNCHEFYSIVNQFDAEIRSKRPNLSDNALQKIRSNELAPWVRDLVLHGDFSDNIRYMGLGPLGRVTCYNMYDVNGFRFHTESYGATMKTTNSGVCVRGSNWQGGSMNDFYGVIEEIIQLEYAGTNNKIVLFNCRWFDTERGIREDKQHGLVEVNYRSSLRAYEPFVLPHQVVQVYYLPYASRERQDWHVAVKTRSKSRPVVSLAAESESESVSAIAEFFQEEGPSCPFTVGIGEALDEARLLLGDGDPEIVPEDELPKSKRSRHDN